MDDTLDSLNKSPFDFSTSLPLSLQMLAATKVALQLWRNMIFNQIETTVGKQYGVSGVRDWSFYTSRLDKEFSCREVIEVPTRIGDMIDKRILFVGNELRSWLGQYLLYEPSIAKVFEMYSLFFDDIVFKQDCTICVKSTVASILTSTKATFEPTAKYRMACEFCVENCVRQLWPLVNNNVGLLGQSPLVLYWNRVMMRKRRKAASIDDGLMSSVRKRNWAAAEYLWDKLSTIKQTSRAIDILEYGPDFGVVKFLLPRLNDKQASEVCTERGNCIFDKMIEKEYFEYALKSWIYMKDFISGFVFTSFICELWLIIFNPSESDLEIIIENGALLHEIWATAPNRLKEYALYDHSSCIYGLFDQVQGFYSYDDMVLRFEIFPVTDRLLGRTVWLENWRKLVIRFGPWKLKELMRKQLVLVRRMRTSIFRYGYQ